MDQKLEEFIKHSGVVGMKWGVRKARGSRPASGDAKKAAVLKKRKPHELTNKQLKTINERQRLESEYARQNPSSRKKTTATISKGKASVAAIIGAGLMAKTVYDLYNSSFGQAAMKNGAKFMNQHKEELAKRALKKAGSGQLSLF